MSKLDDLLALHRPLVKYDSQEAYFADSAAVWTDNPGNVLKRANGTVIASAPAGGQGELSLAFLAPATYANGEPVLRTDTIGDPTKSYREQARKLHEDPRYRNRVYGRTKVDRAGARWLQYWLFYFYNDYNLMGHLGGGLHEGDWEMIQIRLGTGSKPDHAVYAQHKAAQGRPWNQVDLLPGTQRPIVYVARGSHASYFEPGTHWTGVWFDHADGKRKSPELQLELVRERQPAWSWIRWPGVWGDTKKAGGLIDADSPRGPVDKKQWTDPLALLSTAEKLAEATPLPEPMPPPAPRASAAWARGRIRLRYDVPTAPGTGRVTGLAITINSPDEKAPPTTVPVPVSTRAGTVDVPLDADSSHRYDIYVSAATADKLASASTRLDLAPRAR